MMQYQAAEGISSCAVGQFKPLFVVWNILSERSQVYPYAEVGWLYRALELLGHDERFESCTIIFAGSVNVPRVQEGVGNHQFGSV